MSTDGKFVYGANRLHDTIVVFAINPDGWLIRVGEVACEGDYVRHFDFEPNGNFCYVLNQRSDHIAIFQLDKMTGMLRFTNQFVPVGNPSKIVFLTL
jgi:6-phosphogluconolactonase (cycloisomerase 2 family)